jgi:hypothetical protein
LQINRVQPVHSRVKRKLCKSVFSAARIASIHAVFRSFAQSEAFRLETGTQNPPVQIIAYSNCDAD